MNRNRNQMNHERDDSYENVARGQQQQQQQPRLISGRLNGGLPAHGNLLNPHYQNPVDLLRNYNRNGGNNEPEENIYERLDNEEEDEDDDENIDANDDNENNDNEEENCWNPPPLELNNCENHTYERIDNRPWYRSTVNNRQNLPNSHFWNLMEASTSNSHYDQPRYVYAKCINNQSTMNRLGRLGRNCFSSENIASAGTSRRYVYQLSHNRICQSCTRFPFVNRPDSRYVCQYCNSFHDRLRYYTDTGSSSSQLANSRHYIYQVTRNCRCPFCRGDYHCSRFPINSNRFPDSLPRDCQCRTGSCTCRGRIITSSNSAIYIGRIDRFGLVQGVNNPIYANPTIYIGRLDRSCTSGFNNVANGYSTNSSNLPESGNNDTSGLASVPSTSGSSNSQNEASQNFRNNSANAPSTSSGASSVCPVNTAPPNNERRHVCDDSCIRNNSPNVGNACQFLSRNERQDCQHGRVSFHWWFVNRWLPPWGSQNQNDRNQTNSEQQQQQQQQSGSRSNEAREHPESDTEESRD